MPVPRERRDRPASAAVRRLDEPAGAPGARLGEDLAGRAVRLDAALVQEDHPIRDLAGEAHLAGDDAHDPPCGREVAHGLRDLADELRVEAKVGAPSGDTADGTASPSPVARSKLRLRQNHQTRFAGSSSRSAMAVGLATVMPSSNALASSPAFGR